jgi:hypothetical protein
MVKIRMDIVGRLFVVQLPFDGSGPLVLVIFSTPVIFMSSVKLSFCAANAGRAILPAKSPATIAAAIFFPNLIMFTSLLIVSDLSFHYTKSP